MSGPGSLRFGHRLCNRIAGISHGSDGLTGCRQTDPSGLSLYHRSELAGKTEIGRPGPTKLARRRLDLEPLTGMPPRGHCHPSENLHPLPGLERHLRDMPEVVELRPDAGHDPVGHNHADAAACGRHRWKRAVTDV